MAESVCPAWLGWWLTSPLRKLFQNPDKILGPYMQAGMTVLELGPGMGFFSLPAARMVGPQGRIICVDLQKEMIEGLQRRAAKAGLLPQIETRVGTPESLKISDLKTRIDFAFAIAVVHEVPDQTRFFKEVAWTLKPKAKLLFAEPKGHVSRKAFQHSLDQAEAAGLRLVEEGQAYRGVVALLEKAGK